MGRRAFRPLLAATELESRISPSLAALNVRGVPVVAYGSAVNRGMFDGLVGEEDSRTLVQCRVLQRAQVFGMDTYAAPLNLGPGSTFRRG